MFLYKNQRNKYSEKGKYILKNKWGEQLEPYTVMLAWFSDE